MWKLIYGLIVVKWGEEDPFEGRNNDNDEDNDKEDEKEKDNTIEEEIQKKNDDTTTDDQQQEEHIVQDAKILSINPAHDTNLTIETIIFKDVPKILAQNINPLTIEDLKKILEQSTL